MSQVNQKVEALASTLHQAMMEEGAETMTEAELRSSIASNLSAFLSEDHGFETYPTDKDFVQLEKKHHAKKHHKKHGKKAPTQSTLNKVVPDIYVNADGTPIRRTSAMELPNADMMQNAQPFMVPIDEVNAIHVTCYPHFNRDIIDSITLKAFRKVIGYDTFASILRKDRDEIKDPDDHYNITISMMVRRVPPPRGAKVLDKWNGGELLAPKLDKGFPYDDGDNSISDAAPRFKKPATTRPKTIVGKLNGENVTKESLKTLIQDKTSPVTQELIQLDADIEKSDKDSVFKLMDANVTRGQMKNLVTDRPSPITVKLAQKSDKDSVFKLMDANVSRGQLKNLVTDRPSPITVKLAQKSDKDSVFKLMDANVTRGQMKNLVTDRPSPITVKLAQKSDKDSVFKLMDANVTRGQMKNLVTDRPSPITVKLAQKSDKDSVFKLMDANVSRGQMKNLLTDRPSPITVKL